MIDHLKKFRQVLIGLFWIIKPVQRVVIRGDSIQKASINLESVNIPVTEKHFDHFLCVIDCFSINRRHIITVPVGNELRNIILIKQQQIRILPQ